MIKNKKYGLGFLLLVEALLEKPSKVYEDASIEILQEHHWKSGQLRFTAILGNVPN